jgi:hypothetical protein
MLIVFFYIAVSAIVWGIYNHGSPPNYTGLILAVIAMFSTIFLQYTKHRMPITMVKYYLIVISSIFLFIATAFPCVKIDQLLTWLLRINIACIVFSISNMYLIFSLLFVAAFTPSIKVSNSIAPFSSGSLIHPSIWIVLSTAVLFWFYNENKSFKNGSSYYYTMVIAALFIPAVMYFINGRFVESRTIMLCLLLIFDLFNDSNPVDKILSLMKL